MINLIDLGYLTLVTIDQWYNIKQIFYWLNKLGERYEVKAKK